MRRGSKANLTAFLHQRGLLNPESVEQISRYSILCDHPDVNEFQPHARDAFGKLFIPGSAIKGAIRTTVMYARVDEDRANGYVQRNRSNGARFFAGNLDREVLQSYELPDRNLKAGPHFDLLRAVKISDIYGDRELNSRVEKITIQSYTEGRRGRTASLRDNKKIYVECLDPGSWVEFDLKVDEKIIRDFHRQLGDDDPNLPFTDESSLLKLVNDFYAAVWEREQGYYGAHVVEEPEPANEPEKFPEMAEWMKQNYPEKGKTQQRFYRGEYRVAREAFEARQGQIQPAEPLAANVAVRDGAIRVGEIKAFYSGTCPGFRLGWGSGLFSTTVDMRLDDDSMGEVLNKISSRHHDTRPTDGPKTRKLVGSENAPSYPMGWAGLEVRG